MIPKERMNAVMRGQKPDRVPLMCQMALGFIYKNSKMDPVEYWFTNEGRVEAWIKLAEQYHFDGILINHPGLNPSIVKNVKSVEKNNGGHIITWQDNYKTYVPQNDDPRPLESKNGIKPEINISDIKIEKIKLNELNENFSDYFFEPYKMIIKKKGKELSIHGEVGTVFEKFLWGLGGPESGLMALVDDPEKCLEIMEIMNQKIIKNALKQCSLGIDALKLSSPFAGAGFISREYYAKFVLPFEKEIIDTVHEQYQTPCYIHTCGAIGDRLDLMMKTGTDGLECLDPPPLGTIDLKQAVQDVGKDLFIKGNLDSVNELCNQTPEDVVEICRKRIEIGKNAKGYILSTACSISPMVPEENVMALYEAVNRYGWF